ncbi:MAG: hypothetical protein ABFD66_02050 [Smithella sp.]
MTARSAAISAGWTYAYSDALEMEYATRDTPQGPEVMTADKVRYSPDEISTISSNGGEISLEIHRVKRIFDGTIVYYRPHDLQPEAEKKPPETRKISNHDPQLGLF